MSLSRKVSSAAPTTPGDDCIKDRKEKAKKFIIYCKGGVCRPLFDKNGKQYKGDCKLIKKSNEKHSEHVECVGDCPDLYLTDPTKDKKAKPVDSECTMVGNDAPGEEEEISCICIYS